MLMKPPPLAEQMDNLSHLNTESDARQSSRSKNKNRKKQNSLSLRSKPLNTSRENEQKQREGDNGSVHSYASGKSKRSKKKQSSIGVQRPKGALMKANSPMKSQQDDIEVLDYEAMDNQRHILNPVQYSEVKNDYVPITPQTYQIGSFQNSSPNISNNKYSFKNVIRNDQQIYQQKHRSNNSIDDEIPVVKLVQNRGREPVYQNKTNSNMMVSPKIAERSQTRKLGQLFQQNRRNLQTQSNLGGSGIPSQINSSSVMGNESRRSRSKLGQLFKQKSKQKQINNNSSNLTYTQNASSNFQGSISDLNFKVQSQIQNVKNRQIHSLGGRSKEKQTIKKSHIPQKVLQQSVHQFEGGDDLNRDDLNLSLSRNSPFVSKIGSNPKTSNINNYKDSVCFNLEPEKQRRKKGLGVASKLIQDSDEMIRISGNLQSKNIHHLKPHNNQDHFISLNQNMVSKQIDAHQKLRSNLRQNQKYLMQSGAMNFHGKVENQYSQIQVKKMQQIKRKEQAIQAKQRELQRQKNLIAEKNRQELFRIQQQRQIQKKKQQQLRIKEQSIRKEEEKRRQEQKRKEQNNKREQQKRLQALKQQKQQETLKNQMQKKIRIEKQKQLQQQSQRQLQQQKRKVQAERIQRQKQINEKQRKRFQEIQQAKIQKQRIKQTYSKQRQSIKSNNQNSQKNSLIYELQSNQVDTSRQQEQQKIVSLDRMPSSYSRQHSSNGSQRSNNSKKVRKNKQSVIPVQQKKKIYTQMSPRAEASFYEQNKPEPEPEPQCIEIQKPDQVNQMPRKLMSFNSQQDLSYDPKPQYKTDSYFYDRSLKAPSSKPPISKKSSVSRSKSKQGLIEKKTSKVSQIKVKTNDGGNGEKKLSLIDLAMRKNYEPNSGSEYQSQDSFRSRENSMQSNGSKKSHSNSVNSRGSRKKQSVIRIKQNKIENYNRPPSYKKIPIENTNLMKRNSEYQSQINYYQQDDYGQYERQRIQQEKQRQNKPRIIKGCSFIDQNGKLVEKGDMIIKGNQITGTRDAVGFNQKKLFERLMNSREKRRSRSRQRSLNRSRASSKSIEKVGSKHSYKQYAESQAYSQAEQSQTRYRGTKYQSSGQNFYRNDQSQYNSYVATGSRTNFNVGSNYRTTPPTNLQQFIKPIEEAGINSRKKIENNEQTLRNQLSQKKRSMQRTEKGSRGYY